MFRTSLKEKQAEKERFNGFLEDFGIDKNAELRPSSSAYLGNTLTEKEILTNLIKHGIIGDSILGRLIGKLMIYWHSFHDPASYYASYRFELIDKTPNQWRLNWFDRAGY